MMIDDGGDLATLLIDFFSRFSLDPLHALTDVDDSGDELIFAIMMMITIMIL